MKRLPFVVAAMLAAACQTTPPGGVKTPVGVVGASAAPIAGASAAAVPAGVVATGVTVTGSVRVPAGIIAAGGMNLVATGGGSMIAAGGGNIIAAGGMNYGLLAVEEQAVAGARVFLADAAGNAIPGLDAVKTDAKGDYTIPGVPPDFTFVVAAEVDLEGGKKATFQTLAKPGKLGATASLDAATTMVAANVLEGATGSDLGEFNPAAFKTAAETAAKNLAPEKLPDFSDRASVRAKMQLLVEAVADLRASVEAMRTEIATVKKTLEELKVELQRSRQAPGMPPPPGQRPSGAPSGAPPIGPRPSGAPEGQPPMPAACVLPGVNHQFEVPDPAQIATVEFRMPQPGKEPRDWPNGGTARKEAGYWSGAPEGCPLHVVYKDAAGVVLGVVEGYTIPAGSEPRVVLPKPTRFPPPPGTSPSAQPSGQPSGQPTLQPSAQPSGQPSGQPQPQPCTSPMAHKVRIRTVGAAKIKFGIPGATPGTAGRIVAEASADPVDGSFAVTLPQGCAHMVVILDAAGNQKATLQGYAIPTGSPTEITVPI